MADPKAHGGNDPARGTLRDDDDDEGSLIRGGEGVRPLTAHTPVVTKDAPEDEKARAPTMRLPVFKPPGAQGDSPPNAESDDPETQRIAALNRIEQAAASLSGQADSVPPKAVAEAEAGATTVNPVVDADTVLGRTDSKSRQRPRAPASEKVPKKSPPRPRRKSIPSDEGPATIKVPVMTPSRLAELAEKDDADAWLAIEKTLPSSGKNRKLPAERKTVGDLPKNRTPSRGQTPLQSNAREAKNSTATTSDREQSNTERGRGEAKKAAPSLAKGEKGDELSATPVDGSAAKEVPHSAFAQPTLMANVDDIRAGGTQKANAQNAHPESTRVASPQIPPSETEMAEGPTASASAGETNAPDSEWEEPTVAEDMRTSALNVDSPSLLSGEVRAGLPAPTIRPSHRVATVAPVAALSAVGGPLEAPEGSAELPGVPGAPPLLADALGTDAIGEATDAVEPAPGGNSDGAEAKALAPPAVGNSPRDNRTDLLGTIDLDPTDDASEIEALQQAINTDHMGTPNAGVAARPQPPPAPHTFHDDDLPPPPVSTPKVPPKVDRPRAQVAAEADNAQMRAGAAEAIAKAEAAFEHDAAPAIPEKIGIYKIEGALGEGGMAEVFRATHPSRGPVVLKRMRPSLLVDKRYVEMFVREAKIATTLQHPNIVSTLDFGAAEGAHYLVMEELVGMSLRDLADRVWEAGRSVPLETVLRSCAAAARGLHHAHEAANLVHRDVSPDNVFVTGTGATKMLDFGIAKQPDSARLTRTGEIKGKVPFMSPEHILGDPPVSGQSDVWSLGITLYWLLCGTRPFDAATDVMTLQAVVESAHVPPSQRNNTLPASIDEILARALQKRPSDRYATAADFADALDAAARALIPDPDDTSAFSKLDRQVAATIEEAQRLPLPKRPARAPYPACVSVFVPPDLSAAIEDGRVPTEAMVPPKKNSALWLVAGLMLGALGAFVLAALLVAEFVLPNFFGSAS